MSLLNWMSARTQSKTMDGVDTELAMVRKGIGNDRELATVFFNRFTTVVEAIDVLAGAPSGEQLTAAINRMLITTACRAPRTCCSWPSAASASGI